MLTAALVMLTAMVGGFTVWLLAVAYWVGLEND